MTAYAVDPSPLGARSERRDSEARLPLMRERPARPTQDVPDAVLVARVLAGDDRHAFAELTKRHQSAIRALLRRLTRGDLALADDLAQDTFLQVYRNLKQFRGDARFSTWIYRIGYNAFLAHVRGRHAGEALSDELIERTIEAAPGRSLATDSAMKMDIERALGVLSVNEREAIIHCYYHDLTHEEAAYVLGCPLGTLKTNVLRARQKLRAALAAWGTDGGA